MIIECGFRNKLKVYINSSLVFMLIRLLLNACECHSSMQIPKLLYYLKLMPSSKYP